MLPFIIPTILGSPVARRIGAALVLSGILIGIYFYIGSRFTADCKRDYAAARAESIERAAAQAREIALQDAEIINWSDKIRTTTIFKTLWKEHENTVYVDCQLTPAQRVLHNRATRHATDLTDSGIESGSGESSSNSGERDVGRDGGATSSPHGSDAPIGDRPGDGPANVGFAGFTF